jgi:hypothetical protein
LQFKARVSRQKQTLGGDEQGSGRLVELRVLGDETAEVAAIFRHKHHESIDPVPFHKAAQIFNASGYGLRQNQTFLSANTQRRAIDAGPAGSSRREHRYSASSRSGSTNLYLADNLTRPLAGGRLARHCASARRRQNKWILPAAELLKSRAGCKAPHAHVH